MASSKKNNSSFLNFRSRIQPEGPKWDIKGSKPIPNPVTIQEALLTLLIDVFRRILFANTKFRIGIYLAGLFLSFIFDFFPFPKTYFSRSDNMLNLYFVKLAWFWTLVITVPFVFLTSFTYCCGKRKLVYMHLSRLLIATMIWFAFTKSFAYIEQNFGKCTVHSSSRKRKICPNGQYWDTLDISGHIFILIWSNMVITEEAKAIIGWDQIGIMIQNEDHLRILNDFDVGSNLRFLSDGEFQILRASYKRFSLFIKGLFIALTLLVFIWNIMIVSTIVYFHIMVEKLLSGILALSMWYVTYKYWYPKLKIPPHMPGEGCFKYSKVKVNPLKSKFCSTYSQSTIPSEKAEKEKFKRHDISQGEGDIRVNKRNYPPIPTVSSVLS